MLEDLKHPNINGRTDVKLVEICRKHPSYRLPIVTEESIEDRSKSDVFTKAFAIIQSTWLIVQSLSRLTAGLPITELELATMAYVLCAVIMYGMGSGGTNPSGWST